MAQCINNKNCLGWCNPNKQAKWNRSLNTYIGKQKYNAPSLFDICKLKVREVYRTNWSETMCLPKTIQQELLTDWLHCDEVFPELSDDEEDKVKEVIANENPFHPDRSLPLSTDCFVSLMMHPFEIPDFVDEMAHVHFKYVVKTNVLNKAKQRLCMRCFGIESQMIKPYSENLWKQQNVTYYEHVDHNVISADEIFSDVIWDTDNWCDRCITEPLFFIVDKDTCRSDYGLHTRKRPTFWNDYSTDDDSDNDYCHIKRIKGNEIPDAMFKFVQL